MTLFSAPATPPVSVRGRLLFSAFLFRTLIPIFFRLLLSAFKLRRFYKPHPEVLGGFISVTQFRSRSICAPVSHDIVRSSERVFFFVYVVVLCFASSK